MNKLFAILVIGWTFMSFMLIGWAIKYCRDRSKRNKKKDNRKLLKD